MIFDWSATAALAAVQNTQPEAPLTLSGEGLWVCLVSSGTCTASLDDIGPSPAGSALILPPQNAPAGHLILSRSPLTLTPAGACHLLCLQLTGQAALQFLAGLPELPFLARGETCPAAAELMGQLAAETDDTPHSRARSQLAFALLCELSGADSAAPALPPLVQEAMEDIRANYAGLYGVEELSERLGVSKSHLVRMFTAALGIPPGRYLTKVRVEAAMRQLPLPGVQKRNRPLPRAVAGYGRSVPPPRPLPGGEPARAGALHLNQFFLSGSAVSRARFFAVYILSSASFTASLIFLRAVSNSVQPTDTRGRMGIPARKCP